MSKKYFRRKIKSKKKLMNEEQIINGICFVNFDIIILSVSLGTKMIII
jgi:hypothetical protein